MRLFGQPDTAHGIAHHGHIIKWLAPGEPLGNLQLWMAQKVRVKVDRPGVYFGQCSELCGARHGYMPIAVEVVPQATFDAWVASKGGTPKGAKPSTEATPANAAAAPAAAAAPTAGTPEADKAAVAQPALNQAATAQN